MICVQSLRLYISSLHPGVCECEPQAAAHGRLQAAPLGRSMLRLWIMLVRPAAGDKKSGCVRVLYDTTWSTRGVVQTVGRKPRGKSPYDFQVIWVLCPSRQEKP